MSRSTFRPLEPLPDDTVKMQTAIDCLNSAHIRCKRKTKWQLKIGDLNYYPDNGTISRDGGDGALSQRGLEALMRLIAEIRQRAERVPGPEALILTRPVAGEDPAPRKITLGQLGQAHGSGHLQLIPPPSSD